MKGCHLPLAGWVSAGHHDGVQCVGFCIANVRMICTLRAQKRAMRIQPPEYGRRDFDRNSRKVLFQLAASLVNISLPQSGFCCRSLQHQTSLFFHGQYNASPLTVLTVFAIVCLPHNFYLWGVLRLFTVILTHI